MVETDEVFCLKREETQGPKISIVFPENAQHVNRTDLVISETLEQLSISNVSIGEISIQEL